MVNLPFQSGIQLGAGAEVNLITFYHGSWRQEKIYSRRIPHISQLWLGALGPWQPRNHLLSRKPRGKVQVDRMGSAFYGPRMEMKALYSRTSDCFQSNPALDRIAAATNRNVSRNCATGKLEKVIQLKVVKDSR